MRHPLPVSARPKHAAYRNRRRTTYPDKSDRAELRTRRWGTSRTMGMTEQPGRPAADSRKIHNRRTGRRDSHTCWDIRSNRGTVRSSSRWQW
jgi:hypothetical protein